MTRCPSCHSPVLPGETICLDCGTELVLVASTPAEPPNEAPAPSVSRGTAPDAGVRACEDCGESVAPDVNGLCPVCGAPLEGGSAGATTSVERPTAAALPTAAERPTAAPASTPVPRRAASEDLEAEFRALEEAYAARPGEVPLEGTAGGASSGAPPVPPAHVPLPGDRSRSRYRPDAVAEASGAAERLVLRVEGGQKVFYDGAMTDRIPFDVDELQIGRRDPASGHYPEIDLTHYRTMDGHISRRHARLLRIGDRYMVEDLCANDATWLNDKSSVLNGTREELRPGDRVIISDSVALVLVLERGASG